MLQDKGTQPTGMTAALRGCIKNVIQELDLCCCQCIRSNNTLTLLKLATPELDTMS